LCPFDIYTSPLNTQTTLQFCNKKTQVKLDLQLILTFPTRNLYGRIGKLFQGQPQHSIN